MTRTVTICVISAFALSATATQPATKPATTSAPAAAPAVMKILKALEETGRKYHTIRAEVTYKVEDRMVALTEKRTGWVALDQPPLSAGRPERFRIHFETLSTNGGRKVLARVDYAFDGYWLTVAKHRIKQMTRYQIVPAGRRAKARPMELGKGPFPLPFGQKADEIVERFAVVLAPPAAGDPKDTHHLKLTTRRRYRKKLSFRTMDIWVARKTHLPDRIVTLDRNKKVSTVDFVGIKTNPKLKADVFRLPRPIGWQLQIEKLDKQPPGKTFRRTLTEQKERT